MRKDNVLIITIKVMNLQYQVSTLQYLANNFRREKVLGREGEEEDGYLALTI